jgi:hypothetical protein
MTNGLMIVNVTLVANFPTTRKKVRIFCCKCVVILQNFTKIKRIIIFETISSLSYCPQKYVTTLLLFGKDFDFFLKTFHQFPIMRGKKKGNILL